MVSQTKAQVRIGMDFKIERRAAAGRQQADVAVESSGAGRATICRCAKCVIGRGLQTDHCCRVEVAGIVYGQPIGDRTALIRIDVGEVDAVDPGVRRGKYVEYQGHGVVARIRVIGSACDDIEHLMSGRLR